jgi:hypothetical protein
VLDTAPDLSRTVADAIHPIRVKCAAESAAAHRVVRARDAAQTATESAAQCAGGIAAENLRVSRRRTDQHRGHGSALEMTFGVHVIVPRARPAPCVAFCEEYDRAVRFLP